MKIARLSALFKEPNHLAILLATHLCSSKKRLLATKFHKELGSIKNVLFGNLLRLHQSFNQR